MLKSEIIAALEKLHGDPEIPDWENLIVEIVKDVQVINANANFINREQLSKQGCGEASRVVQEIRDRSHHALTRYRNLMYPKSSNPTDEQASKV